MDAADIARVCHEANRALQHIYGDLVSEPWDEASDEQRESCMQGVLGALEGRTPEQSHESWLEFKEAHGWVYGDAKDEVARTHPCILPYAYLPAAQQVKDTLFLNIVTALQHAPRSDF